ncbi:MAG: ferrous iron transport protein B, partial [Clostridia bacterium]|nr:ferrous iron transport protein B [Clostridia bacterium]
DVLIGEWIIPFAQNMLTSIGTADWLIALITDGIIGGVGSVLSFLPQLALLFFLLSLLEDSGYMARIAFLLDKIFRKFGLSGKSFIPILIGTGCSVPGIMASRTIESESDRKMTVITTSFMPCSAKLPVIAMIAGAMFDGASWVAPSAYLLGIVAILVSGLILKKTKPFKSEEAPFIMELPAYHMPKASNVMKHTWERVRSFAVKAGTVIFVACVVIWLMSNFSFGLEMVDSNESMLADIGSVIAPVFKPLGFGTWEASVATLTGLAAKENIVGTLGVLYGSGEVAEDGIEIWNNLQNSFTPLTSYSFLMFNLLCAPCIGALGAIKREIGKGKIALFALTYQTMFAYIVTFVVYNVGKVLF